MIKSMTGFGKAEGTCGNKKIHVEIKSLNSKQADISVKLPAACREREMELRNELAQRLVRGKIDIFVNIDAGTSETDVEIQPLVAESYYRQIQALGTRLDLKIPENILSTILRFPDVFSAQKSDGVPCPWEEVLSCVRDAITQVEQFRKQEGIALANDLSGRVHLILQYQKELEILDPRRMDAVKTRIRQHLDESGAVGMIDHNRFEQELIYYLEKMDITEEKVRLANHCAYFLETIDGEEPAGRKLGFITQEMGREINTTGSKANEAAMQQIVVAMKDELEKIKEQLLNIL